MANKLNLDKSVASREISRKFGNTDDCVELHIYNINGDLLSSDYNFVDYKFPNQLSEPLSSELDINPTSILESKGFKTGKYNLTLNIHKKKILSSKDPFSIKEISPSRKEIRAIANKDDNATLSLYSRPYINEIESSIFFKEDIFRL